MAKQGKATAKEILQKDRTIWYTDLHYIDPVLKEQPLWAAQVIYFAKKNSKLFLDPVRARKMRKLDSLDLNEKEYREMFDPTTPMGKGGDAKYVAADFKACPIYIHLKNVVKAEIQRTAKQLEVNLTDKLAKTRRMRENYKVLYSGLFRNVINQYAPIVGLPQLTESQDPFKWATQFFKKQQTKEGEKQESPTDIVDKFIDLIRNQIKDSQDLAIYNEFIYKGDYEQAFEKGIQHYLINQNKWDERWSDEFIDDIMHFNKASGEWYTDLMTGRPVVERFVPELLWVSPFKRKDGEDMMYYFIEYEITFADFARTIGKDLTPQKLKDVFEYNKTQGSHHGFNWTDFENAPNRTRDDAMIRVGKCSCLTQNYDVFMDGISPNYPRYEQTDVNWYPSKNTPKEYQTKRDEKHYNVWYSFYYIPPTTNSLSNADYNWQAQFVFDIRKNQDQFRYGEQGRYSKSPLVIYDNSRQATFSDIVEAYMPKINHAWHKYQNCLINDIDATIVAEEFLGSLLNAVDEDNKINPGQPDEPTGGNGRDAAMEQWKMIKQGSSGFLKMTNLNGEAIVDPSKYFVRYKNEQLERAEKYLREMLNMYNLMTMSLAMTDAREGQDVKPRTTIAALEESLKSSNNATFFIQKAYEEFLKMYAERIVQYIVMISKEVKEYGYTKRFDEFKEVIGEANGLLVEGMEDVPPESVGMTVNYVDNTSKKDFVMQLAVQYIKEGKLDDDFLYLIIGCDNWKYSYALMRMGIKRRKAELSAKEELDHQRQMEAQQMQLKIAMALQGSKGESKDKNIQTQGMVDEKLADQENKLKTEAGLLQKEKMRQNREFENEQKARLDRENNLAEKYDPVTK